MVYLGDGLVWSQELRDPLDQPNITFSKHVTPRKMVKSLSHRWNISFSSVLYKCRLWWTEVLTCSSLPQPGEETQGIWLADVRGKAGIWQQRLLLGWRTWWQMGFEEDWDKWPQFHVKLFLVWLKCKTLIKLWRVWKIGKLVFVSVSLSLLLLPSKSQGSAIWQHICNKK